MDLATGQGLAVGRAIGDDLAQSRAAVGGAAAGLARHAATALQEAGTEAFADQPH